MIVTMKTIFTCACMALLLLTVSVSAEQRPNFIIVYVDDLGWADTSVPMMVSDPESASDFNQTPHLEKLASRGMVFSNAYAPAPTCTPSRKSIQFGKTPGRLGYTFVHDVLALQKKLSWKDEVSLADVIKSAAPEYITAHFGKGMSGDRMETIGYDVTDEVDGNATNDNFHGEYVSIKGREPLPADNPKRMASLQKSSVERKLRSSRKVQTGVGRSFFDLSVSGRSLAASEGPGPLNKKQKQSAVGAIFWPKLLETGGLPCILVIQTTVQPSHHSIGRPDRPSPSTTQPAHRPGPPPPTACPPP